MRRQAWIGFPVICVERKDGALLPAPMPDPPFDRMTMGPPEPEPVVCGRPNTPPPIGARASFTFGAVFGWAIVPPAGCVRLPVAASLRLGAGHGAGALATGCNRSAFRLTQP